MKKDIEWAKSRIKNRLKFEASNDREVGFKIAMEEALEIIDQLDEPEVLSQEWIDDNSYDRWMLKGTMDEEDETFVSSYDLQNLLVPKQELPVIPKFVADQLEYWKRNKMNILWQFWLKEIPSSVLWWLENDNGNWDKLLDAGNNGYEVEEEAHPILQAFDKKAEEYRGYNSSYRRILQVRKAIEDVINEEEEK